MGEEREGTGKDIRRYYCEFCGIGRSKKSLINAHVLAHHKEEAQDHQMSEDDGVAGHRSCFACEECGATFRKPAYLKQHMQGHSLEMIKIASNWCVKHWIPYEELQNAGGCIEWTSSRWGTSCEAPSSLSLGHTQEAICLHCG